MGREDPIEFNSLNFCDNKGLIYFIGRIFKCNEL